MTDVLKQGIDNSLELFQSAVDRTSTLEIIGAEEVEGKDILIVENSSIASGIEGHQCTVDVTEIFSVIRDCKTAQEFIDVINGVRNAIVCHGVTRIVGYYSRTHNWNKSKIGELRDRKGANYALSGQKPINEGSREKAVNSLS